MAIVIAFRIGIALAPAVYRIAASGGVSPFTPEATALKDWFDRLLDPTADPGMIAEGMTGASPEGTFWSVADYASPFETRKMVVRWTRTPAVTGAEDVDVIGVQFLKTPGGVPSNAWVDADYVLLETAFDTLWTTLKTKGLPHQALSEYRWYADGPAYHPAPPAGNPARRVTSRAVAGTSGSGAGNPPQTAESVTFKTDVRRHWGRIYWPSWGTNDSTTDGTIKTASCDSLRGAWVTFLNAARAAELTPVVYGIGSTTAYGILSVQVDDLFDVIRRRRWKRASYKTSVNLT